MLSSFRRQYLALLFISISLTLTASTLPTDSIPRFSGLAINSTEQTNTARLWTVAGTHAAIWGACFVVLNKAWYADYKRVPFHFFNDNNEWLQMDKGGHIWTAYLVSRLSTNMWKWTGLPEKKAVILGGAAAIAFQSIIEVQDGFSQEWGFSIGDMTANVIGAAAYVSQQLTWKEQRILIKFSSFPYSYPADLKVRRDQLSGTSYAERILKDYNGQTYWLSANIKSFFPETRLPAWLNISVGYAGRGMLGGTENRWTDKSGLPHDRTDIARTRHFYLSPDIDLSRIKTSHKWLSSVLSVVNIIKIPAPALEIGSGGKFRLSAIQF
ncbi:MAG: DUF2279 domain-containing protein [Chitinophagaceae bacterium]